MSRARLLATAAVAVAVCAVGVAVLLSLRHATARTSFLGEADTICGAYHDAVDKLGTPHGMAGVPAWARRVRPLSVGVASQLAQLAPPASKRSDYERFLALVRRQLVLLDTESAAAKAKDAAAFARVSARSHRVHAQEATLAKRLGLYVCGR